MSHQMVRNYPSAAPWVRSAPCGGSAQGALSDVACLFCLQRKRNVQTQSIIKKEVRFIQQSLSFGLAVHCTVSLSPLMATGGGVCTALTAEAYRKALETWCKHGHHRDQVLASQGRLQGCCF